MIDTAQLERAMAFADLHGTDEPFRLVNAWDTLSARIFALAGAPAIGTSSFAVALANGYPDGQRIPWPRTLEVVSSMVQAVSAPVTVDIEAGQGHRPSDVAATVADVLAAGAVGVNLEDSRPDAAGTLYDIDEQCARLTAARQTADAAGVPLFLNARCDVYFGAALAPAEQQTAALSRAEAYVEAGADGLFLPGLSHLETFAVLSSTVAVPINAMLWPGLPSLEDLAAAGVRRISQGGASFLLAAGHLEQMTRAYLEGQPDTLGGDTVPAYHLITDLAYR